MKEELFNKLYKETFDDISKYVICSTPNINDVNDILQIIYMDIFKIINKDNYDLLNKSYIRAIAKNKINDYYRYNYKQKIVSLFTNKDDIEDYKDNIDIEKVYDVSIKLSDEQEIKCKYQLIRVEKGDSGLYTISGRFTCLSNIDKMTLVQFCMKKDMENLNKRGE